MADANQSSAYKLIGSSGRIPTEENELTEKPGSAGTQAEDLI